MKGAKAIPRQHRSLVAILLTLYALGVVVVLAWPTPVDASAAGPLRTVTRWFSAHGLGWVTYSVIEFSANIAMFAPIGFLLALTNQRLRWWHVVGGVAALSTTAEIAQSLLRPDRFGTVQDVLANTAGAALGFLAATYLHARRPAPENART